MICGDLAVAGVVSMPTAEELGGIIWEIRKGAYGGLKKLKIIEDSERDNQIVVVAFVQLYNILDDVLSMEEKLAIGWNILMLEHALCKYGCFVRLGKRKRKYGCFARHRKPK